MGAGGMGGGGGALGSGGCAGTLIDGRAAAPDAARSEAAAPTLDAALPAAGRGPAVGIGMPSVCLS